MVGYRGENTPRGRPVVPVGIALLVLVLANPGSLAASSPAAPPIHFAHVAALPEPAKPSGKHGLPIGPRSVSHGRISGERFPNGPGHRAAPPPGAEVLESLRTRFHPGAGPSGSGWGGANISANCYGVWPSQGGQGQYLPSCYGHDEPGLAGYSDLPGSGGNVTWTVILPTSTSAGAMQADLYSAIWFGMPLRDPFGFLGECFLELQFYPDDSDPISGNLALNKWSGAAVAWQIEATTGVENECFFAPLTLNGSSARYLVMHGGDTVAVKMIGWEGSPTGEYIQVLDLTTHALATVTLYNTTGRFPLDPAYDRATWENSLQWTPGGELPVTFAFETGHTAYPNPDNNSYGGCSAGAPPSSRRDPAVPCPSYDPGSWINDTAAPFQIYPPTFFNATESETASQVAFTQDLGGISFIDPISNGSCLGRDGSAWCSYPWFSYSCNWHAFEFGATDWPTTSADFGRYGEFAETSVVDRAEFAYYPATNASVPACGSPSDFLGVNPSGGAVHFLNATDLGSTTVSGLLPGPYSISAAPIGGGSVFAGWRTTAGASVPAWETDSPDATVELTGNGTISATWSPSSTLVTVQFNETNANASVEIVPGVAGGSSLIPPPTITVGSGGSIALAPGIYSIESQPAPGWNFSTWTLASGDAEIAAGYLPFTWIDVGGSGISTPKVTVDVRTVPSTSTSSVLIYPYATAVSRGPTGNASGSIVVDGVTYPNSAVVGLLVGTHTVAEHPAKGSVFAGWYFGGEMRALNFANATTVTLENGSAYLEAAFSVAVNVTLDDAGNLGAIDLDGNGWSTSGSVATFPAVPFNATLAASPPSGETFLDWTATPASNLSVARPTSAVTRVAINGSGILTAHFAASTSLPLLVTIGPVTNGAVTLDGVAYPNGSTVSTRAAGLYVAGFQTGSLESLQGWNLSGSISAANATALGWPAGTEIVNLTGAGATLGAVTQATLAPVDLLLASRSGLGPGFRIGNVSSSTGTDVALSAGAHVVRLARALPPGATVRAWNGSAGITVLASNATAATFVANGSGSLFAEVASPLSVTVTATPQTGGVLGGELAPETVDFAVNVSGGSGNYTLYWGLPNMSAPLRYHIFTTPGVYPWWLYVQDQGGDRNATTVYGAIVVGGPPLTAHGRASPSLGEPPFSVNFTATGSGGARPYQFAWWVPALGLNGSGPNLSANLTLPGVYTAIVNVSDGSGFLASAPVSVDAVSPLSILAQASAQRGRAPFNISFTASAVNGYETGPYYTYNWSFGDGGTGNGSTVRHEYRQGGNFTATVSATDSLGRSAAQSFLIQLLPPYLPLSATVSATPDSMDLGSATVIAVNATGGTGLYTYQYPRSGVPTGCIGPPSINASRYTCDPSAPGTYHLNVTVDDTGGRSTSAAATLVVHGSSSPPPPARNGTTNGSGLPLGPYLAAGAALGIVAVVVALVLWRRRRPPPEPAMEVYSGPDDEEGLPPLEVVDDTQASEAPAESG